MLVWTGAARGERKEVKSLVERARSRSCWYVVLRWPRVINVIIFSRVAVSLFVKVPCMAQPHVA